MEFRQLLRTIEANAWVAFAAFALCASIGVAAAYLPAKQYKTSTTLLAQPNPRATDPLSSVQIIQIEIPQLATQASAGATVRDAVATLPAKYARAAVDISATGNSGTDTLEIQGSGTDPGAVAAAVNAVAQKTVAVVTKSSLGSEVELLSLGPAPVPSSPSNPRKPILIAAGAIGLIAAVFAALAAAGIRRRLSRADEVKESIGAVVLGEIPRIRRGVTSPKEVFADRRLQVAAEAFQELRSSVALIVSSMGGSHQRGSPIVAVTSCDAGEGKTSITANLAWALATEDHRVLAVDCDLRKAMLHTVVGVGFGPGTSNIRSSNIDSLIRQSANPSLQVIPAGIPDRHPADVLSVAVPLLLDQERSDITLLDCPPLNGAAETILVTAMADAVIVVVDARRFDPERLRNGLAQLDQGGANVIGVVLNRARFGRKRRQSYVNYAHASPEVSIAHTGRKPASSAQEPPERSNGSARESVDAMKHKR
jgi:succinoglycan biosynthesis transport protein ExoP